MSYQLLNNKGTQVGVFLITALDFYGDVYELSRAPWVDNLCGLSVLHPMMSVINARVHKRAVL